MCIHCRWSTRFSLIFIALAFVFGSDWHEVLATKPKLTPKWPRCKVDDGPIKIDHGKKVTWVSCVCEGNGTCSMDVDRLMNWASLFPGHYNVVNVTCATRLSQLSWTNNEPVGVIQDVVIKDCTLAKNTTLFAAKSPLEELWLENLGNEITKAIFEGIERLESLLITRHEHRIVMDFLSQLPYLKHLTINGAGLNTLPAEVLNHNLQYLDVNNNSISAEGLPNETLTGQGFDMQDLYLDHNRISDLSNYSFNGRVKYLYLSKNGLHSLQNETFSKLKILRELDLSSNELKSLPADVFKNMQYLYRISLAQNRLNALPADVFQGLASLKYVNVGGNELSVLPEGVFKSSLKLLGSVHLHNNKLRAVPREVLRLPSVNTIDLSRNMIQIGSLNDIFINPKNPSENVMVDLRNNSISNIPVNWADIDEVETLQMLMKKAYYQFNGNSFNCDCNIYGFHRLMRDIQNETLEVWMAEEYIDSVVCASPAPVQGRTLFSLSETDMKCPVYENCPDKCHCYRHFNRDSQSVVIVNCTDAGLTSLPAALPAHTSEFYADYNKILSLNFRPYMSDLLIFSTSFNNITLIDGEVVEALSSVGYLSLHHNNISYLPPLFSKLNTSRISIHHNPLMCDCHTLWMKTWIMKRQDFFDQVNEVRCTVPSGGQQQKQTTSMPVLKVGYGDFVCISPTATAEASTSGLHTALIGTTTIVIITVLLSLCGIFCGAVAIACRRRMVAFVAYQPQFCAQRCQQCPEKTVRCMKNPIACSVTDDGSEDLHPLNIV